MKHKVKHLVSLTVLFSMLLSAFSIPAATAAASASTQMQSTSANWVAAWHGSITDGSGEQAQKAISGIRLLTLTGSGTFRVQLTTALGGQSFRLKLSNRFGTGDISVGGVSVALQGSGMIHSQDNSTRVNAATAAGASSFTIQKGGTETVYFTLGSAVPAGTSLMINIYCNHSTATHLRDFALTGGSGWIEGGDSRASASFGTTGHLVSENDGEGDYNLLPLVEELDVDAPAGAYALVFAGDSTITNSITEMVQADLRRAGIYNVSVVSSAIKGNELLQDGAGAVQGPLEGEAFTTRFAYDVVGVAGVRAAFVKVGVNDILHPMLPDLAEYFNGSATRPSGFTPTAQDIIDGYENIIAQADAAGIELYISDINPFIGYERTGGSVDWTEANAKGANDIREAVNAWLAANSARFKKYVPFSAAVGTDVTVGGTLFACGALADAYTTDKIHPSPAGMQAEAELIDPAWFGTPAAANGANTAAVKNIWVAANAMPLNGRWIVANSSALAAKDLAGQASSAYLVAEGGAIPATVRRGTAAAPYILVTDALSAAVLTRYGYGTRIYWTNAAGKYLSYQFGGGSTFDVTWISDRPKLEYSFGDATKGTKFTFNTTSTVISSDPWEMSLHFGASSTDHKFLVYNSQKGYRAEAISDPGAAQALTYFSAVDNVVTCVSANAESAAVTLQSGAAGAIVPVGFVLEDDLLNNTATITNAAAYNRTELTLNGTARLASLLYSGYAYGGGLGIACSSDNSSVAYYDISSECVKLGGGFGTARLTWTFSWVEADGTGYSMTVTTTVTNTAGSFTVVKSGGESATYPALPGADMTALVSAGYLYGGTFADAAMTTPADFGEGNAMEFTPVAGATYYLSELPGSYLAPKNLVVWDNSKTIVDVYLLSGVPSVDFKSVGFMIDGELCEVEGNVVWELVNIRRSGAIYQRLYINEAGNVATQSDINAELSRGGYVAMYHLSAERLAAMKEGNDVEFLPYWITRDGMIVTGTATRTVGYPASGTKLDSSEDAHGSECAPEDANAPASCALTSRAVYDGEGSLGVRLTLIEGDTTRTVTAERGDLRGKVEYTKTEGRVFAGWYLDAAFTTPAELSEVDGDLTLYAKYVSGNYLSLYRIEHKLFRRTIGVSFAAAVPPEGVAECGFIIGGERVACRLLTSRFMLMSARTIFGRDLDKDARIMSGYLSAAEADPTAELLPYWVTPDGTVVIGSAK